MDRTFFEKSLSDLRLDEGWFAEIPKDLYLLAVSRNISGPSAKAFYNKYGTITHQELEFYGDRVLSLIASMIVFQMDGLQAGTRNIQNLYENLTSNLALLDLTIQEKFCSDLIKSNTCKYTLPTSKHNVCSDSLEAIMGALFYYGLSNGKANVIKDIYNWFISFPSIISFLEGYFKQKRKDLIDLLNTNLSPIDWNVKIDIDKRKDLWKPCPETKSAEVAYRTKSDLERIQSFVNKFNLSEES